MATKNRAKKEKCYSDPLEDYNDELCEDLDDEVDDDLLIGEDISEGFNSADSKYIRGEREQISARRKIERMNELKALYSQFDDWDDPELGSEW